MFVLVVVLLSLTLKYFPFCVLYFQYICLLPPVIPVSLWRTSLFHLFPPLSSLSQQYCALSHGNYNQHGDVVKKFRILFNFVCCLDWCVVK